MTDDSSPRRLPLAEAFLAWTPSHLLDAIREAEAAVPAEVLARWGRDPIATMTSRRARPQRGRTLSLSGLPASIVALDRAWDAVFDDVRLKVETGSLQLTGRMARPDNRQHAEPIPSVWGRALDFDLRAGAIFMQDQTFVAVEILAAGPKNGDCAAADDRGILALGGAAADEPAQHLTLFEALVQWCDPRLVTRVREEERKLIAYDLHRYPMPKLTHETEWTQPNGRGWIETNYVFLTAAWNELTADFRQRIARSEIYLEGVLSSDDPNVQPEAIPNIWAAELQFDLRASVVVREPRKYLAVTASLKPSPWTALGGQSNIVPVTIEPLTATSVRALTDDEVLLLLEDHARRVVEDDAKMIAPGRISVMPIVKRKLAFRATQGLLETSIAAEAAVLERWIADRLPSHQTPTAGTIENSLRKDYAALRARSSGTKP